MPSDAPPEIKLQCVGTAVPALRAKAAVKSLSAKAESGKQRRNYSSSTVS